MNLIVALVATSFGLTKQQILDTVSGYRQRRDSSVAALERMFERDKDDLRGLGVPIQTIPSPTDPADLREARYRIPAAEFTVPDDLEFTPAELAVLTLAGQVWSQGSQSADARAGLRKIRALGIDVDEPILGFAPRLSRPPASFPALQSAIERGREVRFDYLKPGEEHAVARTLAPYALVEYEGRWHVYGRDSDADDARTFLLSRIVSPVRITAQGFDTSDIEGAGERALAGLRAVADRHSAVLSVTPGTEAALRLRRRAVVEGDHVRLPYVDEHILADELASYGPEVRVREPKSLRRAVIARLEAALWAQGSESA